MTLRAALRQSADDLRAILAMWLLRLAIRLHAAEVFRALGAVPIGDGCDRDGHG